MPTDAPTPAERLPDAPTPPDVDAQEPTVLVEDIEHWKAAAYTHAAMRGVAERKLEAALRREAALRAERDEAMRAMGFASVQRLASAGAGHITVRRPAGPPAEEGK